MGMNFPSSPAPGQVYGEPGGYTYVFLDGVWRMVQVGQSVVTAGTRNRVVNGAMRVSQENGTSAILNSGYVVDQFALGAPTIATVFAQQATLSYPPNGVTSLKTGITTAKPSLAATDYWQLVQYIEGARVADFKWGTANAKQVVVRFWAISTPGGTFTFTIRNGAADRVFTAPFTLPNNAWTEVVIVVPGDTQGVWPVDNTKAMGVLWNLAAGATYAASTPGWSSNSGVQIPGNTNLAATANATFYLTNVGLYLDPGNTGVPPPWEMPDEAEELRACQRYYQTVYDSDPGTRWMGGVSGTASGQAYNFPVVMRTPPAFAAKSGSARVYDQCTYASAAAQTTYHYVRVNTTAAQSYRAYGQTTEFNARM